MTAPTITHTHGFLDDCDVRATIWSADGAHETGLPSTMTTNGDVFTITGTCNDATDEYAYYERDITDIARATYPKITVRWKTSAASAGLAAHVRVVTTGAGAGTQDISLGYSTTWTTTTTDLTGGTTIDKVQLMANDSPDDVDTGPFYVYFDFIMIHGGTYTLPYISDGITFDLENRVLGLQVPSRLGDITQILGTNSAPVILSGTCDTGSGWHGSLSKDLEYLMYIHHRCVANNEPWQWFTSDLIKGKLTPVHLHIEMPSDPTFVLRWRWELQYYHLISGSNFNWETLYWDE